MKLIRLTTKASSPTFWLFVQFLVVICCGFLSIVLMTFREPGRRLLPGVLPQPVPVDNFRLALRLQLDPIDSVIEALSDQVETLPLTSEFG